MVWESPIVAGLGGAPPGFLLASSSFGSEEALYLWLGVACFGLAALLLGTQLFSRRSERRARRRAVRLIHPYGPQPVAPSRPLARWRGFPWFNRRARSQVGRQLRRAELRAEQAFAVLRSELTPHLVRMLKDRLVWTLLSQRARLLGAQQASAQRVAALEHRLSAIQMQLQKQTQAYERRIAELERELEAKDRLTRELIKVRIRLTRQALEAVRVSDTP